MALPVGSYSGGAGGAAGPSNAAGSGFFDNSGWNVNFGAGNVTSSRTDPSKYTPWLLAGAAALLLLMFVRRGR